MNQFDFSEDEKIIAEALLHSREIQEYIWNELSFSNHPVFDKEKWAAVFQKRVDKISAINSTNGSSRIELRKRVLQQAALSICALKLLDDKSNVH